MRALFPCTTRKRGDQYSNRRPGYPPLTCVGGHNPYRLRRFRPGTDVLACWKLASGPEHDPARVRNIGSPAVVLAAWSRVGLLS